MVRAAAGGKVSMPMFSQVDAGVQIQSTGRGSLVDVSDLTDFDSQPSEYGTPGRGTCMATDQGTIDDPKLTTLNNVSVTLDGTGTLSIDAWKTLTNGGLTTTGGTYAFPALMDVDGSSLETQASSSLTLPAVTSYTEANGGLTSSTLEATGAGSVLSLPSAKSIAETATGTTTNIEALSGGDVDLPSVTQVTGSTPTYRDCSRSGATVVSMPTSGTGKFINVPQLPAGVPLTLGTGETLTDATFDIAQNDSVVLNSGTYARAATFNAAVSGATLDLTGGQTVTYSGTLTGSGDGTVQFSGGTLAVGVGGLTLNFPEGLFQWTGGQMELTGGDATNLGTVNLSGSNQTQIYADGTLYDYGTIIQSGTGDFGLHSDNLYADHTAD